MANQPWRDGEDVEMSSHRDTTLTLDNPHTQVSGVIFYVENRMKFNSTNQGNIYGNLGTASVRDSGRDRESIELRSEAMPSRSTPSARVRDLNEINDPLPEKLKMAEKPHRTYRLETAL